VVERELSPEPVSDYGASSLLKSVLSIFNALSMLCIDLLNSIIEQLINFIKEYMAHFGKQTIAPSGIESTQIRSPNAFYLEHLSLLLQYFSKIMT